MSARNGKELAFLQPKYHAKVPENVEVGTLILALPTNRPGRYLHYTIKEKEDAELFSIGSIGEVVLQKPLDYEITSKHQFTVMATDGTTNATTEVLIDVLDVNDWEPRFRQSHYDFVIPKGNTKKEPIALGKLEAADGDVNDKVTITIKGAYAHLFDIDSNGMLWLKEYKPNLTLMHLIATATDSGIPPRSSSVPVTISLDGLAMARSSLAPGVLGAFGAVVIIFLIIIVAMSAYIYKQRVPSGKNRIHSQSSNTSGATLVNHEKFSSTHLNGTSVKLQNPLSKNHSGSGSSISAGASTILAASLEREAQRERERERENYAATVRSKNST